MSRFKADNFTNLLEEYKSSVDGTLLKVEKTLRHFALPDLDRGKGNKQLVPAVVKDHKEVKEFTGWLKSKHLVNKIHSLAVLNRERGSHDEETIAQMCRDFGVVKMNWRRLDLSVGSLWKSQYDLTVTYNQDHLKTLHLYSSGNATGLNEWFGEDGLKKLDRAFIHPHVGFGEADSTEAQTTPYLSS